MRRSALLAPVVTAVLLAVAACGSGDSGDPDPTPSVTATVAPAPEALSGVRCEPGADGLWSAAGTVSNDQDEAASYTVEVYVGPADGQERPAHQVRLEKVQPGESTPLSITGVASGGDPATCHIRLTRDLP